VTTLSKSDRGRIVQATHEAGEIRLTAQADGLAHAEITVASELPKTTDASGR
jgi:hypothetical protein